MSLEIQRDEPSLIGLLAEESKTECFRRTTYEVWARNISQGGMFVICDGESRLPENEECIVELGNTYMRCKIVRSRPIQEGFFEYGITFLGPVGPDIM